MEIQIHEAREEDTNPHGFITSKKDGTHYTVDEYQKIFTEQLSKLVDIIRLNPSDKYVIPELINSNTHRIWEKVIKPRFKVLATYPNVKLNWKWVNNP